jgi:pimeloyl-ACP methyl ester carboxylesterase
MRKITLTGNARLLSSVLVASVWHKIHVLLSTLGLLLVTISLPACRDNDAPPITQPATPPAGFRHANAQVNGVNIHYVIGGQGDPLVLLHGFPVNWYEWNRIMPQLAEHYTVIVPDLRGVGESAKPAGGYDKRTMAEDVFQLIQQLGYSRIRLAGHDIGMQVAYAYAATHREGVHKLVLIDTPLASIEPFWSIASGAAWWFGFHGQEGVAEEVVAGQERAYLTNFYTKQSFVPNAFTDQEINEFVRAYSVPGALKGSFSWYRAFAQDELHNQESVLTRLTIPVLALGGEMSAGPLIVNHVERVAEDVTGGSIPDCGHWIVQEQPDYVLNQLLSFFEN